MQLSSVSRQNWSSVLWSRDKMAWRSGCRVGTNIKPANPSELWLPNKFNVLFEFVMPPDWGVSVFILVYLDSFQWKNVVYRCYTTVLVWLPVSEQRSLHSSRLKINPSDSFHWRQWNQRRCEPDQHTVCVVKTVKVGHCSSLVSLCELAD